MFQSSFVGQAAQTASGSGHLQNIVKLQYIQRCHTLGTSFAASWLCYASTIVTVGLSSRSATRTLLGRNDKAEHRGDVVQLAALDAPTNSQCSANSVQVRKLKFVTRGPCKTPTTEQVIQEKLQALVNRGQPHAASYQGIHALPDRQHAGLGRLRHPGGAEFGIGRIPSRGGDKRFSHLSCLVRIERAFLFAVRQSQLNSFMQRRPCHHS